MKLIEELKESIQFGEANYKDFNNINKDYIMLSGNEAKQIVKMYELLEIGYSIVNMYVGAGNSSWLEEVRKLKEE